jgi:ferritin-like metal-binding protein YciE
VFEILGKTPGGKACKGMKGVLEEGAEVLEESPEGEVRDAAMVSAAQRVENYGMAGYGTVRSYPELLGQSEIAKLLQATLDEEGEVDKKLTQISKKVNTQA